MKYFFLAFKNWNKFKGEINRPEFILCLVTVYNNGIIILIILSKIFLDYNPIDTQLSFLIFQASFNLIKKKSNTFYLFQLNLDKSTRR